MNSRLDELPRIRPFEYARYPELARLDCNEVATPPNAEELQQFQETFERVALNRYPDMTGRSLRESLANHWGVSPDEILLGNGSIDTLCTLLIAYAEAAGGIPPRMLFPDPSFDYYPLAARRHGFLPIAVPLTQGFELDQELISQSISRHTPSVCIFASPNNPTGNCFSDPSLRRLAECSQGAFVIDEAYVDYTTHSFIPWALERHDRFVMRTFSKIGYAGLRLGALVGHKDSIARLDRFRVPWNVNSLSLAIGCAILQRPEIYRKRVRQTLAQRDELFRQLQDISGLTAFPSDANFILVRTNLDAARVHERLLEQRVLVKLVSRPGLLDNCLRISVGTKEECERCVSALRLALWDQ